MVLRCRYEQVVIQNLLHRGINVMHGCGNPTSNCSDNLGVAFKRLGLFRIVYDPQAFDSGVDRAVTKIV